MFWRLDILGVPFGLGTRLTSIVVFGIKEEREREREGKKKDDCPHPHTHILVVVVVVVILSLLNFFWSAQDFILFFSQQSQLLLKLQFILVFSCGFCCCSCSSCSSTCCSSGSGGGFGAVSEPHRTNQTTHPFGQGGIVRVFLQRVGRSIQGQFHTFRNPWYLTTPIFLPRMPQLLQHVDTFWKDPNFTSKKTSLSNVAAVDM